MNNNLLFLCYQNQENLGVGYLSSYLEKNGFRCTTYDITSDINKLVEIIKELDPILIGISLIFQYYTDDLKNMVEYLREKDVKNHITVGGHYPSLKPRDFLEYVKGIDSVVRFEGEETTLELAKKIRDNEDWKKIRSIAFIDEKGYHETDLRPLIENLDNLPFPKRVPLKWQDSLKIKSVDIIASRGCLGSCVFCSIRAFYSKPPGNHRRERTPKNVVEEMKILYTKGARIFIFQDDDFLQLSSQWLQDFNEYLNKTDMANKLLLKISCRSDELNPDVINLLKKIDVFTVYLGIESGYDAGLKFMNKHITVQDNLDAVRLLNKEGIMYEYGFMLFEPISNFETIRANLNFLRTLIGDGSSPAVFCKMLPYGGTPIEYKLKLENRLTGGVINPDYLLNDDKLDLYCRILHETFHKWMFLEDGLQNKLRTTRLEIKVIEKYYPQAIGVSRLKKDVKKITKISNNFFIDAAETLSNIAESDDINKDSLNELMKKYQDEQGLLEKKLQSIAIEFMDKNQNKHS